MDEELRLWLAKKLNMHPEADLTFDKLWRTLVSEQHVEMAKQMYATGDSEDEEQAKRELLKAAKLLIPYARSEVSTSQPAMASKKRAPRGPLRLSGHEKDRAEALGEYLAFRASLHPLVRRFREEVLGGKSLTPKQAHALVDSDAANRFPLRRFEQHGIPTVGHTASFYEQGVVLNEVRVDKFIEFEYIFVDPPGRLFRTHLPVSVAYDDLEYLWFPNEDSRGTRHDAHSSVPRDEEYVPTPVYPGSVLDDLRLLSQRLVDEYERCWDEAQAAWFVLTGEPVAPKALTAKYHHHYSEHLTHGTITLTVQPWVPTETVAKFYQQIQADMMAQQPRAPERRNLDLFRFAVRQAKETFFREEAQGEAPEGISWGELMERWNKENPDQKYTRRSRFFRDFCRGARAVLDPCLSPYTKDSEVWTPMTLSIP